MVENCKIRERARISLGGKLFGNTWLMLAVCIFIATTVLALPGSLGSLGSRVSPAIAALTFPLFICTILVDGPMSYGVARVFITVAGGNPNIKIPDLFMGFSDNIIESIKLGFMRKLYTFLWSLLFIIPGIVKAYSYSMAFFIQQEEQDKNWRYCLDKSIAMMNGYKGKLFILDLSFLGWYILGALCLGVGLFWVDAYHTAARAHFYLELKSVNPVQQPNPNNQNNSQNNNQTNNPNNTPVFNFDDEEEEPFTQNNGGNTEVFNYDDGGQNGSNSSGEDPFKQGSDGANGNTPNPFDANGSDPFNTNGSDPFNTNGSDPVDTEGGSDTFGSDDSDPFNDNN